MLGSVLVTTFLNFIAYLILILILQYLCHAQMNLSRRNLMICIIVAVCSMSATDFFCSEEISSNTIIVLYFGTILVLSRRRIIDLLLSLVAFFLYVAFCLIPVEMITHIFPKIDYPISPFGVDYSVLSLLMDLTVLAMLCGIRYITNKYSFQAQLSLKELLISIILPFISLLAYTIVFLAGGVSLSATLFWKISMSMLSVAGYVYYFYTLIDTRVRAYNEINARTQTAYLKAQLDSLQNLKEKEKDVHKMRHDLKNHLTVIESLCAQGQYDKVISYTGNLSCSYLTSSCPISGNKIADTIIHTKMKTAQDSGIEFTFEGTLSGLDALSEPDICGLLANAYDNAIEACLSQEHAYIHTKARVTRNHTYIRICNSIPQKLRIKNNQLKTTKDDKYSHGYGIEIMKQIAHKYHGRCTISSTDSEFILEIMLITADKTCSAKLA